MNRMNNLIVMKQKKSMKSFEKLRMDIEKKELEKKTNKYKEKKHK